MRGRPGEGAFVAGCGCLVLAGMAVAAAVGIGLAFLVISTLVEALT